MVAQFRLLQQSYVVVVFSSRVDCGVGCFGHSKFPGSESSNQHSGEEFKIRIMNIIYPLYQVNVEVLYFLGAFDFLEALFFDS
jgi:hypothetical protein